MPESIPARFRNMARTGPAMPQPTIKAFRCVVPGMGSLLMRRPLVEVKDLPQPIRKRPDQERYRVAAYGADPGVLERGETPFAVLARGDEGLDRVTLRRRLAFALHYRATYRVY